MTLLQNATQVRHETPVGAATRGAAAGLAATLLLSVLARVMPGMSNRPPSPPKQPPTPDEPQQVREWQAREQSPAAFQREADAEQEARRGSPGATPAGALVQPQSPGPEGLAEQFAFKVGAGLFDRDVSPYARPAGVGVHLAYGSAWGMLYGLLQASHRRRPGPFGALYGLAVWLVGPALLVPAMKLMGSPAEEPPARTAMLVAGHVAYGVAVAAAFDALEAEARQ